MRHTLGTILIGSVLFAAAAASAQPAPEQGAIEAAALLNPATQPAVDGVNAFSLDLYKREVVPGKNLLLSPASISTAMALAYRGAKGSTAEQLARVFHYNAPPAEALRASGQMLASMAISDQGQELSIANSAWVQSGMPLIPDYEHDLARYTSEGLQRVDFQNNRDSARDVINHWVAQRTHDKIPQLLHPDDISEHTRLVLVNAIYWKGAWEHPFDPQDTQPEPFRRADGSKVATPLMHLNFEPFQVLYRQHVKAIRLPYGGDRVSMVLLLPDSPRALDKFEQKLTLPDLQRWLADLNAAPPQQTLLALPRLHLGWRRDLVPDLAAMGAPDPFGPKADFSGIAKLPYPGGDPNATGLQIAHTIHQATLDLDEHGAEAAAATGVMMEEIIVSSTRRLSPAPFVFKADHPFLFMLVDNQTGMILFMGRYAAPDGQAS